MSRTLVVSTLVLLIGGLFVSLGLVVGGVYFAGFIAGLVLLIPLMLIPLEHILWGGIILTFLIVGQLQYFAHVSKAFWFTYLFGAMLFLRLPLDLMSRKSIEGRGKFRNPITKWIFAFFIVVVFSTSVNASPILQILISVKEYVFLWSVLAVFGLGLVPSRLLDGFWRMVLWLVPLHIPVIAYQRFVVAAKRRDAGAFDAVNGLFGGDPNGGGASGAMGLFMLFAVMLSISLWRQGRLKTSILIGVLGTFLASVSLAEVKYAILLLPLGVALVFRQELLKKPVRTLVALAATLVFAAGLSMLYQKQFGSKYNSNEGTFGYLEAAIQKNSDADFINPTTGEIGRIASLKYWWRQHGVDDPIRFIVGHGIGSTRYGSVLGEAAEKNLMFRIDRNTAAVLLWDIGLLGFLAFVGLILSSSLFAFQLSKSPALDTWERAVLEAIAPWILLQIPSLAYDVNMIAVSQIQMLFMVMLGQILVSGRRAALANSKRNESTTRKTGRRAPLVPINSSIAPRSA